MADRLWWQRGVVYQVYPRSFKDSNGDGIGDLAGIIEKLDYLSSTLGVDAIWLSPFYPSPMKDFGYDVANYTDVDPMFGNLADFDQLVKESHARKLRIIIDFVPNHTSDQHPWFKESRSSRTSPKRDWYIWRDAKPDGSVPNNWLSVFGGSAWEYDATTKQYYLHSFLNSQPDLNWRNPEVKQAMFDAVEFWLKRGVDGIRIDVAHYIMKDPDLRDNPPNPRIGNDDFKNMGEYDQHLHINDKGHADVHGIYKELRHLLDQYSTAEYPRYSVGEIHIFDWDEWATYYGANLDELHMPFNFGLVASAWTIERVRTVVNSVETTLKKIPGTWPNYVFGNHDEMRIATRIGAAQSRNGMLLLLTLRGSPTIYYGDEIGMHDVEIAPDQQQDPWGINVPGMGRDPQRTPMQWDTSPNAGFSTPQTKPWLPIANDYKQINVAAEKTDPKSMLTLTHRLLVLRRVTPALNSGDYHEVKAVPEGAFAFIRQHEDERYLIVSNFTGKEMTIHLPDLGSGQLMLSTYLDRGGESDMKAFALRSNEGCIIRLD